MLLKVLPICFRLVLHVSTHSKSSRLGPGSVVPRRVTATFEVGGLLRSGGKIDMSNVDLSFLFDSKESDSDTVYSPLLLPGLGRRPRSHSLGWCGCCGGGARCCVGMRRGALGAARGPDPRPNVIKHRQRDLFPERRFHLVVLWRGGGRPGNRVDPLVVLAGTFPFSCVFTGPRRSVHLLTCKPSLSLQMLVCRTTVTLYVFLPQPPNGRCCSRTFFSVSYRCKKCEKEEEKEEEEHNA